MSIIEKIAAVFLSFLIALFGFAAAVCGILSSTFADPEFMIDVLDEHNYYEPIFSEYCEEVEDFAIPSGVDEGVFSAVISKEEFISDIQNIIRKAYEKDSGYAGSALNYDAVYDRFYNCLVEVAVGKGFTVDEELIPALENVSELCASTYEIYVTVPFIDTLGSYATEFDRYFSIGALVSASMFIILIALMCISRKWRSISPHIISISLISAGLMLLAAPLAVIASGKIRHLNIEIKSLYSFAVGYSENLLYTFIYAGSVILALALVVILLTAIIKSKYNKLLKKST